MEDVRRIIIKAVRDFRENGGRLIFGEFGVEFDYEVHQWKSPNHCACALGAVLLMKQPFAQTPNAAVEMALNVSSDFLNAFTRGFDGALYANPKWSQMEFEAYELGCMLAMELQPIALLNGPEEDEEDDDYGRDDGDDDEYENPYGLN